MPGQIKNMLDRIVTQRSRGNPTIEVTTKAKLTLKGLNPDRYASDAPDDPAVLAKVRVVAAEMGISL
jgi:hypothetical protein